MSSSSLPPLVPPVRGTVELAALLRLIQDPKFQADVAKYLTDMETSRKKLNDTIEHCGTSKEISNLKSAAIEKLKVAEETLVSAQAKADQLLEEAKSSIAASELANKTEAEKLSNRRRLLTRDETSHREDMKNREEALAKKQAEAEAKMTEATKVMAEAEELKATHEAAIQRLRDAGVNA